MLDLSLAVQPCHKTMYSLRGGCHAGAALSNGINKLHRQLPKHILAESIDDHPDRTFRLANFIYHKLFVRGQKPWLQFFLQFGVSLRDIL